MTGIPAGLDYAGVEAAARALGIAWTEDLLTRIRTMEHAAIEAMAASISRRLHPHGDPP